MLKLWYIVEASDERFGRYFADVTNQDLVSSQTQATLSNATIRQT